MKLLIFSLATWRIASLLATEDGPYNVFGWLRTRLGVEENDFGDQYGANVVSKAALCPWCSSLWIGLVWVVAWLIGGQIAVYLALPLAISAGAIIVHRIVD